MRSLRDFLASIGHREDRTEDDLRRDLAGLDLAYARLKNDLYAHGRYNDLFVSFRCLENAGRSGLPIAGSPGRAILCRTKIPGTAGQRLQLFVNSRTRPAAAKFLFSRADPEPGFAVGPCPDQSEKQALQVFRRLSRAAKDKLLAVADRYGAGCAVTPDWESSLLGRGKALILTGGDETALSLLDCRTAIPCGLGREDLLAGLDLVVAAVVGVAADLGGA